MWNKVMITKGAELRGECLDIHDGYKSINNKKDFDKGIRYNLDLIGLTFEIKFDFLRIYSNGERVLRKHIKQIRGGFDDSLWDNEGVGNFLKKLGVKEV